MIKRALMTLAVLAGLAATAFFLVVPGYVGRSMNRVVHGPRAPVSARARALHARLLVADLHADSLLWGRDLAERGTWGHVDVPRLVEGNVALQGFTVVTQTPRGQNIERNDASTDNIFWLALSQRWPPSTWGSLRARALHQARRLRDAAAASGGRLVIIESRADLDAYLERRKREPGITAGFLGVEGAHALDGDLASLDVLFDAGFRMMAPTHFFDNDIGGSAHGVAKGGLTEKGREWVRRVEAKGMIVDLAHASAVTIDDVLAIATRPVVVSHTGVKGTCDNARNLNDAQLRAMAAGGGVVGLGFWETAVCGTDARAIARAIRHAAGVAGVDHVGLGSDFDGAIAAPFDASGLVVITDALLREGFSEDEVAKIMGGNEVRLLSTVLPSS